MMPKMLNPLSNVFGTLATSIPLNNSAMNNARNLMTQNTSQISGMTMAAPPMPPSVSAMSAAEAAAVISRSSRVIFREAISHGAYNLSVGGAVFTISMRQFNDGLELRVVDQERGNSAVRVVGSDEAFEYSPQQLLSMYLPSLMTEIAVFLKLEYVGP